MKLPNLYLRLINRYLERDPVDAAAMIESMGEEEAVAILKALTPGDSAQLISHMPVTIVQGLLPKLPNNYFHDLAQKMEPQQLASVLKAVNAETQQNLIEHLEPLKKKQIQDLLVYPENSAGRIMSTQFWAFPSDMRIKDAIQKIRQLVHRGNSTTYAYVTDREGKLVGVLNMRDMMLAVDQSTLDQVMRRNVFAVNCFMDREQVAHELSGRRFFAAPVVDPEQRLVGVVQASELIEDVQEEATEDIQKMFGAGGDERVFSSLWFSLKSRLPWLHVNLATAFLAAWVVSTFEDLIAKVTVLAVFLPVVAGQGGNAGAQSLAVVMRGLVMREIAPSRVGRLILKEAMVGFINGLVIGLVTAGVAWAWQGNPYLGLVIGLGMVANMVAATLSGALIPIVMKRIGVDPAQCSNIILTTITDVMGFFAFLGFALLFQSYLVP